MDDQIINTRTSNQLPVEIIEEILSDLPVKSLLRFKCVSKLWRSLIASKNFIKCHLKKSNTNRKLAKLICDTTNDSLRSYSLRPLLDGNCTIATTLDHHPMGINWAHILRSSTHLCYYDKEPVGYNKLTIDYPMIATFDGGEKWAFHIRVLGSCNGLVLISINRKDLILWNPSTREAKNITPPTSYSFRKKPLYYVYGFGYDESSNDYKVVCIFSSLELRLTEIYSSRTDSWKKIENFDKIFMLYQNGMFVNGRLHWTTIKEGDGSRWDNIVSLDLVEEKFEIVAEPKNFSTNDYSRTTVEDLGGYLSLVSFGKKSDIDVWVMTEYGETGSWTKIWTLAGIDEVNAIPYPVWLRENGDIAVCFGWDVVVYNGKNKLCKSRLDVFEFDITGNLYVESLVSPFGDEHLRRQ